MLALAQYALVAFNRDSAVSAEAAMKYFVLGAIASGTLLYGVSLLYGITGTLQLDTLAEHFARPAGIGVPALLALAFIVAGIAFKFGAVPFHMWVPDVYQGAPDARDAVHRLGARRSPRSRSSGACSSRGSGRCTTPAGRTC